MGVPDKNSVYNKQDYWDKRYEVEDSFEWFAEYETFKELIRRDVKITDKILVLGCGNSKMSFDMYQDGYRHITNIDYSPVVIDHMREKHSKCAEMTWEVKDIHNMTFEPATFDIVLEKGTLDAFLVEETDPWHLSEKAEKEMQHILQQISKILKNNGKFISITFSQPHFRKPLYAKQCFQWSIAQNTFGETFHYFYYTAQKGNLLSQAECDAEVQRLKKRAENTETRLIYLEDHNNEDFLLQIGVEY